MCTGVRIKAKNGAVFYGRTLEFGSDVQSNILMIPRGMRMQGTALDNQKGLAWQTNYAVVGANMLDLVQIADGVNEKGLAAGLFYFPDYAEYQMVSAQESASTLAPWELVTWILTSFSTVDEVKNALPKIKVGNVLFGPWHMVPPVHAIVHDPAGNSLVIEYIDGQLHLRDNPLGVITNSPSFDWHVTNLRNYVNLSVINVPKIQLKDIVLKPFGQGSGLFGIPGDFTPPSRFVRAVAFSQSSRPSNDENDARSAVFHILNLFNIPLGAVGEKEDHTTSYDYTQWTSGCDLKNKRYYWHTYNNPQIRVVDLMQMPITSDKPVLIKMEEGEKIVNKTVS